VDEIGDRDLHRTTIDTDRVLASQAAFRFEPGTRDVVALINFNKVM